MVEWKGSKDSQCSMLSLHFSYLIIYVFRIIQKPRQNWSVPAFISQNANVEVCNLTLTDPARSGAKHLDSCCLHVPFSCCPWAVENPPGSSTAELSLPSSQGGVQGRGGTDPWDPKAQQCLLCSYWNTTGIALLLWSDLGGFQVFAEVGEQQKNPLQIPTGNSQGGGISFLAVQSLLLFIFTRPLGCCRQRCLS